LAYKRVICDLTHKFIKWLLAAGTITTFLNGLGGTRQIPTGTRFATSRFGTADLSLADRVVTCVPWVFNVAVGTWVGTMFLSR